MSIVTVAREIRTADELSTLIHDIKEGVANNILRQIRPDPSPFATDLDIASIQDHGPWPDYLEMRFCISGSPIGFKLSVETYHGVGGTWAPE